MRIQPSALCFRKPFFTPIQARKLPSTLPLTLQSKSTHRKEGPQQVRSHRVRLLPLFPLHLGGVQVGRVSRLQDFEHLRGKSCIRDLSLECLPFLVGAAVVFRVSRDTERLSAIHNTPYLEPGRCREGSSLERPG